MNLRKYIDDQIEWSKRIFGEGPRTKGLIEHIKKECDEIEAKPSDLMEWIDIIIIGIDGAWRSGATSVQIITALMRKQLINFTRKWPTGVPQDKAAEHIK